MSLKNNHTSLSKPDYPKLKLFLRIQSGNFIEKSDFKTERDSIFSYPVYGGNGLIGFTNKYNVLPDTIVVGRVGALCGNVHLITEKAWVTDNSLVLKILLKEKLEYAFLYYLLKSLNLNQYSQSTAQPLITSKTIKERYFKLPSIVDQENIAIFIFNKTSEIDALIADKEKLIKLLEEKRQAIITEAVTKGLNPNVKVKNSGVEWIGEIPEHWEMKKIKRVMLIQNGREILEEVTEENNDCQKYRVYGSGGFFKWTNDYLYNGESVLFGRKGTLGKPLYINGPFWTVDTMYYAKMKKAKARYIYFVLLAFPWEIITTQTALPSIVSKDLGNESWCFPSIEEQNDIISYLDKIEEETTSDVELLKRQIELLKEYRQALIYEAVTGKIDVQEMVKETEQEEVSSS